MFYQGSEASASPDSCEAEASLPIIRIPVLDTLIIEYTVSFCIFNPQFYNTVHKAYLVISFGVALQKP